MLTPTGSGLGMNTDELAIVPVALAQSAIDHVLLAMVSASSRPAMARGSLG